MRTPVEYNEGELQFATTYEIVRVLETGMPSMPTQREEKLKGYDVRVKLDPAADDDGTALFLQFKRPKFNDSPPQFLYGDRYNMNLIELNLYSKTGPSQHQILMNLNDQHPCRVYYCGSILRQRVHLHYSFNNNTLLRELVCIHPRKIGKATATPHVYFSGDIPRRAMSKWNNNIEAYDGYDMMNNARSHIKPINVRSVQEEAHELSFSGFGDLPFRDLKASAFIRKSLSEGKLATEILSELAQKYTKSIVLYLIKHPDD